MSVCVCVPWDQVTDAPVSRKAGYVMIARPGDGYGRRWLALEGPYLTVYKAVEDAAEHQKPKAVVALSSFTIHKTEVCVHSSVLAVSSMC